jgi:hypothetical protein
MTLRGTSRRSLRGGWPKDDPDDWEYIGTKDQNEDCGARSHLPCSVWNSAPLLIPAQSPGRGANHPRALSFRFENKYVFDVVDRPRVKAFEIRLTEQQRPLSRCDAASYDHFFVTYECELP